MGHQDAFLWPGPNDRYRLSQGTLAGTRGNGENAPIPDLPVRTPERGSMTYCRPYRAAHPKRRDRI